MPVTLFGRPFVKALKSSALGRIARAVFLRPIAYGTLREVNTAGITSVKPRTQTPYDILTGSFNWRRVSTGVKPSLNKIGNVVNALDKDAEFTFEIAGRTADNNIDPIALHGELPNMDAQYVAIQPDVPTTSEHGYLVDSCYQTNILAVHGMQQTVTPGGSLASQTWTFSIYVAFPDPNTAPGQNVRMVISLGNGGEQLSQSQAYTGDGKYQRLSITKTFSAAPAVNTIRVTCGPIRTVSKHELLLAAAQLELAGSASAYERTSEAAAGTVNKLLNSHFPTRTGWTPTSLTTINPDAGRGPEIRAIVPTAGTMEFGVSTAGTVFPDGIMQMIPRDAAQTADTVTANAAAQVTVNKDMTGLTPSGKTYILSCWIRVGSANVPANGIFLNMEARDAGNVYIGNSSQLFTSAMLTRAWRRYWWAWYVPTVGGAAGGYGTATRINAQVFIPTAATIGDAFELWGMQLEEIAGDSPRLPKDYEPTTSSAGVYNLFQRSEEIDNAYWAKTNATITANTGYGPTEYYDVLHPDKGLAPTPIRVNPWTIQPAADWEWPESSFNAGDFLDGQAFSIGSYGAEKVGTDGDFTTWAAGSPNGWTRNGTTGNITQVSALPHMWTDDEEAGTPSGVAIAVGTAESVPASNLEKTVALTAGWHTLRLRVRCGVADGTTVRFSLKRTTDNLYLDQDAVRVRAAAEVWIGVRGRDMGSFDPDTYAAVVHLFIPTTTNYVLRVGGIGTFGGTVHVDQARLWDNAGALYASPADRTETKGSITWRMQGLNLIFRGVVDDTTDGDIGRISVRCLGYTSGTDQQIINRTTKPECQIKFRGTECGYVSTTTFTADSGGGTSHTVASTANLEAGRYILSADGTTFRKIVTITDATHFTTDVGDSYLNGAAVVYGECRKHYADCAKRARTHRYTGFRATTELQALAGTSYTRLFGPSGKAGGFPNEEYDGPTERPRTTGGLIRGITLTGQEALEDKQIFDQRVIPVVYGRKSVKLIPIETHATKIVTDSNSEWLTTFYAMAWGEIDAVRLFFTPDGPLQHQPAIGLGIYWHPGLVGEDAWWTAADHLGAISTQKVNNQRRDFRTNTDTAYSRLAYAVAMIKKGNPLADLTDPTKIIELWADLRGRKVQAYDASGRASGSPAWSQNPIWCGIDMLRDRVFGPAFPLIFDWRSAYNASVTAAATITSAEAVCTVRTGATTVKGIEVTSIAGFAPEMPCTVNGAANTVDFVDPVNQRLILKTAVTVSVGHVVQGIPPRYMCDLILDKQLAVQNAIDMILSSCRGLSAYNAGRLALIIERGLTDAAATTWLVKSGTTLTDNNGIVAKSFKLNRRRGAANNYNSLDAGYSSGALLSGANRTAHFTDADRGGLDFPKVLKLSIPGASTADQAMRCALPKLAKVAATVMSDLTVSDECRAYSIKCGPTMLRAQVGDFIQLTRASMTTAKARISRLTVTPKLEVIVEAMPEAGAFRQEAFLATVDPYSDSPTQPGEFGSALGIATLTLSVQQSAGAQLKATVSIGGYAAGPGTSAGTHANRFTGIELHASTSAGFTPTSGAFGLGGTLIAVIDASAREFIWDVPSSSIEVLLYLKAVGLPGAVGVDPTYSGEIPITIYRTDRPTSDPTQQEGSQPVNMVYGGDFDTASDWASDAATPSYPGTMLNETKVTSPVAAATTIGSFPGVTTTVVAAQTEGAVDAADANVSKITDASDTTYYGRQASYDYTGTPDTQTVANFKTWNFGAGSNVVGRIYVRLTRIAQTGQNLGSIRVYYSQDASVASPTWVYVGTYTPSAGLFTDVSGPEVTAADLTKFGIGVEIVASQIFTGTTPNNWTGRCVKAHFEQKAAAAYSGSVSGNIGIVYGDGTSYGNLRRAFPGKAPTGTQVAFNASTLNHVRIQLKKHNSGDTLDANPVEIRIYDANNLASTWTLASIPSSEITSVWQDFAVKFSSGSQIVGTNLQIEVRTTNTKPIDVDKLLVARGDTLFAWTTSPQNQSEGYFGDFTNGDASGFSKGSWAAGDRKKSAVA